jgi:thioredoxin reductase (NADPH)
LAAAEVAIVGAGPIGLELAAGLKHAGVPYVHLEAGAIGSTIAWWSPDTRFFSNPERIAIAGVPLVTPDQSKATREQYLAYLRAVVQQFSLDVRTWTRVTRIAPVAGGFELTTVRSSHGVGGPEELRDDSSAVDAIAWQRGANTHFVRRVVLAIGDMHRPRMIDVPGERLPHVSHYLGEIHQYFGGRVVIVGGKNSAVEAALRLHRAGARVAISYRGDSLDPKRVKYWLRPELEWLISTRKIAFHPRTEVQSINADAVNLHHVDDASNATRVPADFVLLLTGYEQDTSLFDQLGVELVGDERAPRHDERTMETSVPGISVAGTAAAGSQKRARVFIENSHVHVRRIVKAISGIDLPWIDDAEYSALAES